MNLKRPMNSTIIIIFIILIGAASCLMVKIKQDMDNQIQIAEEVLSSTEEDKFVIWSISGDVENILYDFANQYKRENPDLNISIVTFDTSIYEETLRNAALSGNMPDMFYTWGDKGLEELVHLGVVQDITDSLEKVQDELIDTNVLQEYNIQNRICGMPIFGWDMCLFCNKQIFDKHGITYPKNYDELIDTINQLKAKGEVPFMIGGREAWTGSFYYMSLLLQNTDIDNVLNIKEGLKNALKRKEFETAALEAAEEFEQIIKMEPWQKDYMTMNANDAIEEFARGKAAMIVTGSWSCSILQNASKSMVKDDLAILKFPSNSKINCGVASYSDGFALSKINNLENKESIEKLYMEIVRKVSKETVETKGIGIPIYKGDTINTKRFPLLAECSKVFPKSGFHPAYDKLLSSLETQTYNDAISKLMNKQITAEEFIEKLKGE